MKRGKETKKEWKRKKTLTDREGHAKKNTNKD